MSNDGEWDGERESWRRRREGMGKRPLEYSTLSMPYNQLVRATYEHFLG